MFVHKKVKENFVVIQDCPTDNGHSLKLYNFKSFLSRYATVSPILNKYLHELSKTVEKQSKYFSYSESAILQSYSLVNDNCQLKV